VARSALIIRGVISALTAALLAGCGTARPEFSPLGQTGGAARKAQSGTAFMYVTQFVRYGARSSIFVYSYPDLSYIGAFQARQAVRFLGACSDSSNNVYITSTKGQVLVFTAGALAPRYRLSGLNYTYGFNIGGCSVDPSSGNVAVTDGKNVAIYTHAQGTPSFYTVGSGFDGVDSCVYDNAGNLFIMGFHRISGVGYYVDLVLAELPAGGAYAMPVSINQEIRLRNEAEYSQTAIGGQWNDGLLTVSTVAHNNKFFVYQLQVTGSSATVTGVSKLFFYSEFQHGYSWISGDTIAVPAGMGVGFWAYPSNRMGPQQTLYLGRTVSVTISSVYGTRTPK
jgi:hypothetical protein